MQITGWSLFALYYAKETWCSQELPYRYYNNYYCNSPAEVASVMSVDTSVGVGVVLTDSTIKIASLMINAIIIAVTQ